MKANELMLGDWVYGLYPDGSRYKPPFRISAVDTYPSNRSPRIVTAGGYGFQEEDLAPIPLTPEILEKNGFVNNDLPFINGWEQYGLFLYPAGEGYRINCGQNVSMVIDTVHQLQHALKLCGIEKEIVL